MKIEFRRVAKTPKEFEALYFKDGSELTFRGSFFKNSYGLIKVLGRLDGVLKRHCDICFDDVDEKIDEELTLYASDELYSGDDSIDVIEFESGVLDFDFLLESEVESLKVDYFRCRLCIEGEQNGSTKETR